MPPVELGAPLRGMVCGDLKLRMDIHDGLANALDTRKKLYTGGDTGKRLWRVAARREVRGLIALFSLTTRTT